MSRAPISPCDVTTRHPLSRPAILSAAARAQMVMGTEICRRRRPPRRARSARLHLSAACKCAGAFPSAWRGNNHPVDLGRPGAFGSSALASQRWSVQDLRNRQALHVGGVARSSATPRSPPWLCRPRRSYGPSITGPHVAVALRLSTTTSAASMTLSVAGPRRWRCAHWLRRNTCMSQWERGERRPTGAALKLLHVVKRNGNEALR